MTALDREESTADIAAVLGSIRRKGVRLWTENGQLRYQAPKGALTAEDIECLRTAKRQILALLERAAGQTMAVPAKCRGTMERVPLAFSQLSHWYRYNLGERRHLRQIASATRLCGPLDLDALRSALDELLRRHEALRTRIVTVDGTPMQEVSASGSLDLPIDDLSVLPDDVREGAIKACFERLVLEPIDVTVGPLFGVRLLRLAEHEHVLLVAIEHLISDGVSMNILLRDLFVAYRHAADRHPIALPPLAVQFPDYAIWQMREHSSRVQEHANYLMKRLSGCSRVRFPEHPTAAVATRRGWSTVPVEIGNELRLELREWCRRHRATLPLSIFAAYAALVVRWCGVQDIVIRYVTDGRIAPALENTVGYFAYLFFLRIQVHEQHSLLDVLRTATEEYCSAQEYPHFGCIEARVPLPEFARGCGFNWVPQGSTDDGDAAQAPGQLTCTPILFEHPMLQSLEQDIEPFVLFYDTEEATVGAVHFPLARFSTESMARFGRNFLNFIRTLVREPGTLVRDVRLL